MYDPKEKARDRACTPKWLCDALGEFGLDPYSNEHSHVQARVRNIWDGVEGSDTDGHTFYGNRPCPVFVNPPYSRGQVMKAALRWTWDVTCFLLRWDPSTAAFREIRKNLEWAWFADKRIEFEPPPGIVFSSNPFPHALLFTYDDARIRHPNLPGGTWLRFGVDRNNTLYL